MESRNLLTSAEKSNRLHPESLKILSFGTASARLKPLDTGPGAADLELPRQGLTWTLVSWP